MSEKYSATGAATDRWNPNDPTRNMDSTASEDRPLNYVQARKEETRRRIVETASRLFQEKGMDGVGVDEIMREAGLTHGGFYGHFRSKEQLIAEACACAVDQRSQRVREQLKGLDPEQAFLTFVDEHLSKVEGPDCPFSILGGDVARRSDEVREAYTKKVGALIDFMADELGCGREEAILTFTAVVGAITVGRASTDPKFSADLVKGVRSQLLRMWHDRCGAEAAPATGKAKKRGGA